MNVNISLMALDGCKNTEESFGEICVHCNKCGRFNETDEWQKMCEDAREGRPKVIDTMMSFRAEYDNNYTVVLSELEDDRMGVGIYDDEGNMVLHLISKMEPFNEKTCNDYIDMLPEIRKMAEEKTENADKNQVF